MPKLPVKPSFNHQVIAGMTLKELLAEHPDADVEYVTKEWEKAGGKHAAAAPATEKAKEEKK
jgi:hypothetical protein